MSTAILDAAPTLDTYALALLADSPLVEPLPAHCPGRRVVWAGHYAPVLPPGPDGRAWVALFARSFHVTDAWTPPDHWLFWIAAIPALFWLLYAVPLAAAWGPR